MRQHRSHAGIDVGLLRDVLRGGAPRLARRVGLRAAQPALQPAPDRLAEIAALQRAREIAEDGVVINVDRIGATGAPPKGSTPCPPLKPPNRSGRMPAMVKSYVLLVSQLLPPRKPLLSELNSPPPSALAPSPARLVPPLNGAKASGSSDSGLNGVLCVVRLASVPSVLLVLVPALEVALCPLLAPAVVPDPLCVERLGGGQHHAVLRGQRLQRNAAALGLDLQHLHRAPALRLERGIGGADPGLHVAETRLVETGQESAGRVAGAVERVDRVELPPPLEIVLVLEDRRRPSATPRARL